MKRKISKQFPNELRRMPSKTYQCFDTGLMTFISDTSGNRGGTRRIAYLATSKEQGSLILVYTEIGSTVIPFLKGMKVDFHRGRQYNVLTLTDPETRKKYVPTPQKGNIPVTWKREVVFHVWLDKIELVSRDGMSV